MGWKTTFAEWYHTCAVDASLWYSLSAYQKCSLKLVIVNWCNGLDLRSLLARGEEVVFFNDECTGVDGSSGDDVFFPF